MQFHLENARPLYLTKDPSYIKRQLAGEVLGPFPQNELLDRISTDTYPTRACFRFDPDYMASQALTGLKLGDNESIEPNAVKNGRFGVLVAGRSFGCGSSREHFPMSLKAAGIGLIAAVSVERICGQNCQNIGLPYLEGYNSQLLNRVLDGESVQYSEITKGLDQISADIVAGGGLFNYLRSRRALPKPETGPRPMTAAEKILARHMGVDYVKPGDLGFAVTDRRYSYEIFAPFSDAVLRQELPDAEIKNPDSVYLFYDHSVLDGSLDAAKLARSMREMAKREGLQMYDGNKLNGAEGICHTIMMDRHSIPGEVVLGTDSHTCTLGAIGALPIGVGATEWAAALWANQVRIAVPPTVLFDLQGNAPSGVMAKDVMLHILSQPEIRNGEGIGKIFEYKGIGLYEMPFDEQVVFANMAVEGGAFSALVTPNDKTYRFFKERYGIDYAKSREMCRSDQDAEFDRRYLITLDNVEPYIALPGDPRNGVPISSLAQSFNRHINKAYVGSCTGSKYFDIEAVARVLEGHKVSPEVQLFVQTSSREVFEKAARNGLIDIISEAGGKILPPGCGACVNFGPGSFEQGEVGISSTNRNFPGRMGQGEAYLANPAVVAASAIKGKISTPQEL